MFLPQRGGIGLSKPPGSEMTPDERRLAIFGLDRDRILEADVFLFVLDGRVPDEGACAELGMAYGQKHLLQREKLLIGLQTDWRAAFPGARLNPMVRGALDGVAENEEDLMAALESYRRAGDGG